MTATLWIFAAAGFYAGGHMQAVAYSSLPSCEAARPGAEREMLVMGYVGGFTVCRENRPLGKEEK